MHPVLFELTLPVIGRIRIFAFGLCFVIGFFAALSVATRFGRRRGIDPDRISGLGFVTILFGLLGARLFYYIQNHREFAGKGFLAFFKIWEGGIVYYGGILAGAAAGIVYLWRRRLPFLAVADSVAPALAIGLAFGRIGCFLNGCCFGAVCPECAPYGVQFPREWGDGRLAPAFEFQRMHDLIAPQAAFTLPVYPTQLLASLDAFLLFALLLFLERRRRPAGELFFLWMTVYPIQRFLEEALRADNPPDFLGMTISQFIGIPVFVVGIAGLLFCARRPLPPLAPNPGGEEAPGGTAG